MGGAAGLVATQAAFAETAPGSGDGNTSAGSSSEDAEGLDTNWRTPMESVDESQIVDTEEADIVVIGAGHAGTAVARRAAEGGKNVILVEA